MKEAEKSNSVLASQLKGLYGELGTMLATKQKEMDGQSKFINPNAMESITNFKLPEQNFDQSLRASTKFVKIPEEHEYFKEDENLGAMVETWQSNDFDKFKFDRQSYGDSVKKEKVADRPKKFTNYAAVDPDDDEIDEDVNQDEFVRGPDPVEKFKSIEHKFKEQEEKWDQHKELLEARKMLENAMKDANFLMDKEQDMDELATNTHKQDQINKIGNINDQMDEIEAMINQQNESNLRRKPMENSLSSIKTDVKPKISDSGRDPFDKLEDVAHSVDEEEMRKTAKSHKSGKRKSWGKSKAKVQFRTDYNQEPEEDDDVQQDEEESEKATPIRKSRGNEEVMKSQQNIVKQSGRYDYKFENTAEQNIYDNPQPYDPSKDVEQDNDDQYNIANNSLQNSVSMFSPGGDMPRREAKTQENFHRG